MAKMGNEKLKEAIIQLSEGEVNRSATSRLADIIDEVELAIKKGVKRQAIIEQLKAAGLVFTEGSFRNARRRIKARNAPSSKGAHKVSLTQNKAAAAPTAHAVASKGAGESTTTGNNKFKYDSSVKNDDVI